MKVIKNGKIPSFTGKCNLCGCEIEADYKEFVTDAYGGIRMIVTCPTKKCGRSISLHPKRPHLQGHYKMSQLDCEEDFGDEEI